MTNREKHIWTCLREHYEEAISLGHEILVIVVQGSQNYNLDIYNERYKSDVDTKAIVLPSFEDFVKGKSPVNTTHIRANNEHIGLKDIRVMFDTFKNQNVQFLEILFSDYYIVNEKYKHYWEELRSIAEDIVHCHPSKTVKVLSGISMEKVKALCHPYPSIIDKIEKYGYDPKQLHHILRVNVFLAEYIKGKSFKECLTNKYCRQQLLDIKTGNHVYSKEEAVQMAEYFDKKTKEMKEKFIEENGMDIVSVEPYNMLNNIKYRILKDHFREEIKE